MIAGLGALAHETRLELFRLLVQRGPDGMSAGTIAQGSGVAPSSLTFHLQQLTHAGLITQRRVSRQLIYATDFTGHERPYGRTLPRTAAAVAGLRPAAGRKRPERRSRERKST